MNNEFSRIFAALDQSSTRDHRLVLTAEPAECEALAVRFGVEKINSLTAKVKVQISDNKRRVRVHGSLLASVIQICVVTAQPFEVTIETTFDRSFEEEEAGRRSAHEIDLDLDSEDPPDVMINGEIDLGEMIAEEFGLVLDPHPRSPGAEFASGHEIEAPTKSDGVVKASPFAVLATLRDQKKDKKRGGE